MIVRTNLDITVNTSRANYSSESHSSMYTAEVSVLTNVKPTKTNGVRVLEGQAVDRSLTLPPYLLFILRLPGASYLTLTLRLLPPSAQSSPCLWAWPWCLHRPTKSPLSGSTTMIYSVVITISEVLFCFVSLVNDKRPLSLIFKVASKRQIGETTADWESKEQQILILC